jgi:hypothetical protein
LEQLTLIEFDTCGCAIVLAWDDTMPEDQRAHTPVEHPLTKRCTFHNVPTAEAHANASHSENRRKNAAVAKAAEILVVDPSEIGWAMTSARDVVIGLPKGTPQNKKVAVESELNKMPEQRGRVQVQVNV